MLASISALKKRLIFLMVICAALYCAMLCYYVYISQKPDALPANAITVDSKLLITIIADDIEKFELAIQIAEQYQNPYILICGFGDKLRHHNLKQIQNSIDQGINQSVVFIGDISESAYKHAINADSIALINGINSIVVISPTHFIPKARILFKMMVSRETSVYFYPVKSSKLRLGYYHNYLYINFRYLLHKYFELVGFGRESSESFSGV